MSDVISRYVLDLNSSLMGFWPNRRRLLDEVKSHLEESAFHGVDEGLTEGEAERRAVERFGNSEVLAKQFAEDRLHTTNKRTLHGLLPLMVAVWACWGIEGFFPMAPIFHEATTDAIQAMVHTAQFFMFSTLPLLGLTLWLRRKPGYSYASSNALLALFIALLLGCEGLGVARHCEGLWTHGVVAIRAFEIRMAVVVAEILVIVPSLLAHQAYASTHKRVI